MNVEPDDEADDFDEYVADIKRILTGWIGNLMRNMDAEGEFVSVAAFSQALEDLACEIDPTRVNKDDYDNFLKDLNDGRGQE